MFLRCSFVVRIRLVSPRAEERCTTMPAVHEAKQFRQPSQTDRDEPDTLAITNQTIGSKISLMGNKALLLDGRSWISLSDAGAHPLSLEPDKMSSLAVNVILSPLFEATELGRFVVLFVVTEEYGNQRTSTILCAGR